MKYTYFNISGHKVGQNQPVFIIAEAGVNHNGSLELAKKMVDTAKLIGADAIKFQTFKAENLATKDAPKAYYQKKTALGKTQLEMLKSLELSEKDFEKLFNYCRKKRIIFLSTPFDSQSAEFLYSLGVSAFKISSADLTNIPLIKQIAKYKRPLILSTGMSDLKEIKEALNAAYSSSNKKVILLHCTSNYPANNEDVNLKAMQTLKEKFYCLTGYSDHTLGIQAAAAAAAMGACILEKHFTLNKNFIGPDHQASFMPQEFEEMVKIIRQVERIRGSALKKPVRSELAIKRVVRKSIVANQPIAKGTKIKKEMLALKRPEIGLRPKYLEYLVGKRAARNINKDQALTWSLVK
ncbi:MAG: N-acetylneuraminate synthase [Candidatus Omnitrophica bacterium]|jgi:N-acetylneuraminate synthase/N,N'-diacetyllegionaminate synthase|nr:N-acetylneuraminate synthase [Candidatus Omnitrophota bacterium]